MSNTKNTGGPAFPSPARVEFHEDLDGHRPGYREYLATPGMTLRDHFAGLASWAEVEGVLMRMGKETLQGEAWVDAVAQARWILADAMLKAREQ